MKPLRYIPLIFIFQLSLVQHYNKDIFVQCDATIHNNKNNNTNNNSKSKNNHNTLNQSTRNLVSFFTSTNTNNSNNNKNNDEDNGNDQEVFITTKNDNVCLYDDNDKSHSISSCRGGNQLVNMIQDDNHSDEITIIQNFIGEDEKQRIQNNNNNNNNNMNFHFHGWRWHTLSIIRDSSRLQKLADRVLLLTNTNNNNKENQQKIIMSLTKAVDHVIDFNLKGLQRIEGNVFFPWLKDKLTKVDTFTQQHDTINNNDNNDHWKQVSNAFKIIIDDIENDKKKVRTIADNLRVQAKSIISLNNSEDNDDGDDDNDVNHNINQSKMKEAIIQISQQSGSLSFLMKSIFKKEVQLLVPAVSKLIPAKEQIKVNNKILKNLGIFESRAILVGMIETLKDEEYGNKEERDLFEREIPYIPRKMIPRWKRNLYDLQAGMLEF